MNTLNQRNMERRIDYNRASPGGVEALRSMDRYTGESGLNPTLLELVKIRASQINHCAFCIDMHTKDARDHGESEQRLYGLSAWRETPFYTDQERAALAWTEALTLIDREQVSDDIYEQVRRFFGEKELADLTFAILAINCWNRLAIGFRTPPGSYHPDHPVTRGRADERTYPPTAADNGSESNS